MVYNFITIAFYIEKTPESKKNFLDQGVELSTLLSLRVVFLRVKYIHSLKLVELVLAGIRLVLVLCYLLFHFEYPLLCLLDSYTLIISTAIIVDREKNESKRTILR